MGTVTVPYDDDCGFCRGSADRLRARDRLDRLRFVAITVDRAVARRRGTLGRILGEEARKVDPAAARP